MKYESVRIPIKRTSSAYYARLRKEHKEPVRYCAYCGEKLQRRYTPENGRWEGWSEFRNRKCCNIECAQRLRGEGRKADRERAMLEGFRQCKEWQGLYVNRDGKFIYNGKEKAAVKHTDRYGRKHTALVSFMRDGRRITFAASRLVASAFKYGYSDEMYIRYNDGDIHNICADNLTLVTKAEYDRFNAEHAAQFRKEGTYDYQVSRLKIAIESNQAVLYYFQTGKFDKINKHVERYLYSCLCDFCLKSLRFGTEQAPIMAADAIARWYEVLLQGHSVGYGERYCKHILQHFKRKGWYGYAGSVLKTKIELIINNLNLDCLWERYKQAKTNK